MDYEKLDLLINNSIELENVGGIFTTTNLFRKCNALSLTIRNESVNANRIKEAIDIITENTSILSYFRGNNKLTVAITISMEDDMADALKDLTYIYEQLKEEFWKSQFLVLAAIVIFNSRYRLDVTTAVKNTKMIYEDMKKNHRLLTSSEDVTEAAMIAVASDNILESMHEIEECYSKLRSNGFFAGNNLQSLSHILPLFNGSIDEKVKKVSAMKDVLKKNKLALNTYSLPILGVAASCCENIDEFAKKASEINAKLKKEKGFGNFSLGTTTRNMIAVGLATSSFIDSLDNDEKEKIINTTNNTALTIQIAINMAITMASASAAAAASSASC